MQTWQGQKGAFCNLDKGLLLHRWMHLSNLERSLKICEFHGVYILVQRRKFYKQILVLINDMQENYLWNTVRMCVVYFETHWKKDELMDETGGNGGGR